MPADGLAYSALLKNELLGAGIEKVQDPQTEDRRLQPSTPEKKGLFTVSLWHPPRNWFPVTASPAPTSRAPALPPRACFLGPATAQLPTLPP